MKVPMKFPTEREKLAEESARWRSATAGERFQALFEISALCETLRASSPHGERQIALLEESERREHQEWIEAIARHVGKGKTS